MANNFLTFCPTDTGTNLLTQADYSVDTDRTNGNQPGVARSKLVNKAMRQSAFVSSQLAQFVADNTGTDVLDNGITAQFLAQLTAVLGTKTQLVDRYTSGSGTHNLSYYFSIVSGSATAGATYTNNGITYTVRSTVASATSIVMSGSGAPTATGTLTKASGTGDATLTFYVAQAPKSLKITVIGGGAGGGGAAGSGGSPTSGVAGSNSTFGTSLLTANGGALGPTGGTSAGGNGGAVTINSPAIEFLSATGGAGAAANIGLASGFAPGGNGGSSMLGGAGRGGAIGAAGGAGATNTGAGGGAGGAGAGSGAGIGSGAGGGSGGAIVAIINGPAASYAYSVGGGGAGGNAGTGGGAGGAGGSGVIIVESRY